MSQPGWPATHVCLRAPGPVAVPTAAPVCARCRGCVRSCALVSRCHGCVHGHPVCARHRGCVSTAAPMCARHRGCVHVCASCHGCVSTCVPGTVVVCPHVCPRVPGAVAMSTRVPLCPRVCLTPSLAAIFHFPLVKKVLPCFPRIPTSGQDHGWPVVGCLSPQRRWQPSRAPPAVPATSSPRSWPPPEPVTAGPRLSPPRLETAGDYYDGAAPAPPPPGLPGRFPPTAQPAPSATPRGKQR